jgi:hypothetical protein
LKEDHRPALNPKRLSFKTHVQRPQMYPASKQAISELATESQSSFWWRTKTFVQVVKMNMMPPHFSKPR